MTDVTRRDDVHALVAHARDAHGRLDVLINNAGIGPISPLDDLEVDEWDAMIDVNLKGVLHGIAAALPVFRAQGFGHFVNTARPPRTDPARRWRSTPRRSSPCGRSPRACARRPGRTCA